MKKYIKVIHHEGATLDGKFVDITHRMLVEGNSLFGYESIAKLFADHNSFVTFVQDAISQPSGTKGIAGVNNTLSWEVVNT